MYELAAKKSNLWEGMSPLRFFSPESGYLWANLNGSLFQFLYINRYTLPLDQFGDYCSGEKRSWREWHFLFHQECFRRPQLQPPPPGSLMLAAFRVCCPSMPCVWSYTQKLRAIKTPRCFNRDLWKCSQQDGKSHSCWGRIGWMLDLAHRLEFGKPCFR